jgi:hypothetical protein
MQEIRNAKAQYVDLLLKKKNVVACGVGYKETGGARTDELCIVVSVDKKVHMMALEDPNDLIPQVLSGVSTDVQETGIIYALKERTDRWRPAPGGVSIGHEKITCGTLGCLVSKGGQDFILSNCHVLANSGDAQLGDMILQPGPHDGGVAEDRIATLEDFVPINFESSIPFCPLANGIVSILNWLAMCVGSRHRFLAIQDDPEPNLVDAAIAEPLFDSSMYVEKHILEIGEPQGINEGTLGMQVRKSGRTTGLTSGEITQVDATVKISYGIGKTAIFVDQLIAGEMSAGGDSGSAVLDEDSRVVGLLFAGSETTTVMNRIQNVMDALGVSIA